MSSARMVKKAGGGHPSSSSHRQKQPPSRSPHPARPSKRQAVQEEEEEDEEEEEEVEDDESSPVPHKGASGSSSTSSRMLDMIARGATAGVRSQNAPKHPLDRANNNKRKREVQQDEDGEEVEDEENLGSEDEDIENIATFAASSSSPSSPSTSSSSAAPKFAPSGTAVGTLFSNLTPALDSDLLHVLNKSFGFSRMTPVQQQCIPTFLKKDVAVQSYTGSGKTMSFVLPMMQILINKFTNPDGELDIDAHTVAAIILSPTRELATQICSVIAPFVHGGAFASERLQKFKLAQFIGGSAMGSIESDFVKDGGNIIVATPGRLNSTLGKLPQFQVKELRVLILDEADRLLDEGFEQDITDILRKLPKQRRTGLFSATQTRQVKELRRAGLQEKFAKIDVLLEWKKKPSDANSDPTSSHTTRTQMTPTTLQNYYTIVKSEHKLSLLIDFICSHQNEKLIVFFLTGDQVDYFSRLLPKLKAIYSRNLHKKIFALRGGKQGMDQNKRNAQFQSFVKEERGGILIATDVAARGIDVPDVDWIIQFDPPKDPSVFVHRIGRTARMGKSGSAIVYLTPEEKSYVELVKNLSVPISHKAVSDECFEVHHSWKTDPDIAQVVKAMEEGKNRQQAIDAARRQHQARQQKTAGKEDTTASASEQNRAAGSIKSVLREVKYLNLEDRLLMEKAQKAYTSFIDGYKQHTMTHALNYVKLPFGEVAHGMGLLYLPKMPDIKHLTAAIRYERAPVKANFIRFKDAKLQSEHEKKEALIHEKNQKEQYEREKKFKERQKKLEAAGPKRKKKASQLIRDEWEELQNENRLLKKLKQGKITKQQFEIAVGERKKNGQEKSIGSDDDDFSDSDDDRPKKKAKFARGSDSSDDESMSDSDSD